MADMEELLKIEHINPGDRKAPEGYSQVVAATGGRTLYVAGQGAYDAEGRLVGPGDVEAQARQACRNLIDALAAAHAGPEQIVSSTMYVVGLNDDTFAAFMRGMGDALDGKPLPPNASTLVGIERLAYAEMLVEINAIAVV